ncbi:hypothetical protein SAMN02910289_01315 [Lachnospiraceae bacterium RM5]|nr:hypothetical protein SAMN02910289_01315 [Lachnospiraceae bacterium RM5]
MTFYIRYSNKSLKDLDNIWEEIFKASKNLNITEKYISELLDKNSILVDRILFSKCDYIKKIAIII